MEVSEALIRALKNDDVEALKARVKYVDAVDHKHQHLGYYAVRQKAHKALTWLLDEGVDPNAQNKHGDTALHTAAYLGDAISCHTLLHAGARVNETNKKLQTPLMLAAQKGDHDCLETLLLAKADIMAKDFEGCHALFYAIKSKSQRIVNRLLEAGSPVHWLNDKHESLIHYVCAHGLAPMLESMIERGVNPYQKNIYHQTAMHYAVRDPMETSVDRLIELGVSSYDKDHFGESPYDRAELNGYDAALLKFTRHKNDPDRREATKHYPLHHALRRNRFDEALALMETADTKEKDTYGNTPLFYALMLKDHMLVDALLRKGVPLENIDAHGRDAFFYPVLEGNAGLIKRLVNDAKFRPSDDTLALAQSLKNPAVLSLLTP